MSPAGGAALVQSGAETVLNLLRGGPERGAVRQVAVPHGALRLSTHPRVDYADAFVAETGPPDDLTAEEWARFMMEGARPELRRALSLGWGSLGLRRGPTSDPERVLGWEVRRSAPDVVVLGADSPLGLRGEVLFQRQRRSLLFATLIHHASLLSRTAWIGVGPSHRQAVRTLLEQGLARRREG